MITTLARGGMFSVLTLFWERLSEHSAVEVIAQGPISATPSVPVREVPAMRASAPYRYPAVLIYGLRMFLACLTATRDGRRPAVLLSQDSLATGLAAIVAGRLTGTPVVIMEHGSARAIESDFFWNARIPALRLRDRLTRPMLRATLWTMHRVSLRLLDLALLPSQEAVDHYRRMGVAEHRMLRYHVPIDVERFRPAAHGERAALRERFGLPRDATVILSVSRLTPEKGLDLLIDAAERLPATARGETLLVIAGEGHLQPMLEERAAGSPFPILVTGPIPAEELPALLRAADLFVYAARQGSNVPVSTLEAMASGLPVVATTEPIAHLEMLADGRGSAIPADDVAALADAIEHYRADPQSRAATAGPARRYVEEHHGPATFDREVAALVRHLELCAGAPGQNSGGLGSQSR